MVVPMRHDEDRIQKNAELIGEVLNGAIKNRLLEFENDDHMGIISPINTETATIVVAVPVEGLNTETGIEIGDTLKEIAGVEGIYSELVSAFAEFLSTSRTDVEQYLLPGFTFERRFFNHNEVEMAAFSFHLNRNWPEKNQKLAEPPSPSINNGV
jgi:hypothetical protein